MASTRPSPMLGTLVAADAVTATAELVDHVLGAPRGRQVEGSAVEGLATGELAVLDLPSEAADDVDRLARGGNEVVLEPLHVRRRTQTVHPVDDRLEIAVQRPRLRRTLGLRQVGCGHLRVGVRRFARLLT